MILTKVKIGVEKHRRYLYLNGRLVGPKENLWSESWLGFLCQTTFISCFKRKVMAVLLSLCSDFAAVCRYVSILNMRAREVFFKVLIRQKGWMMIHI